MLKADLLKLIEGVEDGAEIDSLIKETDLYKSSLSLDNFKNLISTDNNFKSFMDSEKDKHYSKALETWKTNNLQKIIDDEVRKRNPQKSETELQMEKLQKEIEDMKNKEARASKIANRKNILNEKKVPLEFAEKFYFENDDDFNSNLDFLVNWRDKCITEHTQGEWDKTNRTPPKGNGSGGITKEQFEKMSYMERCELNKNNPELYEQLTE